MPFLKYDCKVCGKKGMAEYENELDAKFDWMKDIICHTRCADFMAMKESEARWMNAVLEWWALKRRKAGIDPENLRKQVWDYVVESSKRYCYGVCKFYGRPLAWEPGVAERIMESPDKFKTVLYMFETLVKR